MMKRHTTLHEQLPRKGFVLVMVLILLTVAAISLSGLARRSLRLAADAADAQDRFERKWQVLTLQRALLANAQGMLADQTRQLQGDADTWPRAAVTEGELTVGNTRYQFVLSDEEAKVNVNQLLRLDPDQFLPVVMRLLQSTNANALIPTVPPAISGRTRSVTALESWGQVFASRNSGPSGVSADELREATRLLTCWGRGRLNVTTATDEAIMALSSLVASDRAVSKLLQERRAGDLFNLDGLIQRLELKAEDRFGLRRVLSDRSGCYSLWLTVSDDDREWTRLVVSQSTRGQPSSLRTFSW